MAPGLHSEEGGYRAMRAILEAGRPFSAVLASNDTSALGVLRALAERGRRVPEDVAVVGFDDQPGASANVPPLASIGYPLADLGWRAVELLLGLVHGQLTLPQTVPVPTRLIRRRSCGCLHRDASTAGEPPEEPGFLPGEDTPAAMVRALERAPPRLPPPVVLDLCRGLETGLARSVAEGSSTAFEAALMELLQRVESGGDRAQRWHAALTCLRRAVRSRVGASSLEAAEDLLHLARVALSESADRQDARRRSHLSRQAEGVSALTVPLQSARDESEILALLAEHAPPLGVTPVCLGLYEPEGDDPVAGSRLIPIETPPGEERPPAQRVETRRLWTDRQPPRDRPRCLAILPLVRSGRPMGFLGLEATSLAPGAAIARQLAVALESVGLQAAIRTLSFTDELTGLHNRRFFEQELEARSGGRSALRAAPRPRPPGRRPLQALQRHLRPPRRRRRPAPRGRPPGERRASPPRRRRALRGRGVRRPPHRDRPRRRPSRRGEDPRVGPVEHGVPPAPDHQRRHRRHPGRGLPTPSRSS